MRKYVFVLFVCCFSLLSAQNANKTDMDQARKLVLAHSAIANLYVDEPDQV